MTATVIELSTVADAGLTRPASLSLMNGLYLFNMDGFIANVIEGNKETDEVDFFDLNRFRIRLPKRIVNGGQIPLCGLEVVCELELLNLVLMGFGLELSVENMHVVCGMFPELHIPVPTA